MGEIGVRFDDGAETVLERWGANGPIMLCVHGMTSSRKGWRRLAEAFSDRYRVFAYDQRGHGDAAAVHGPMAIARGVRDLEEVAGAIGEPIDVLVGHSWGGAVALLGSGSIAARRVVAVDPMLKQVPDSWYAEYLEELRELFELSGDARDARVREENPGAPLDVEGKVHAMHAMTVEPIAGLRRENPPAAWPLPEAIAKLEHPVLLAMADPDESVVDATTMERVRAVAPASLEIVTFEGQGHSLHRTGFDDFVRAVERFIAV